MMDRRQFVAALAAAPVLAHASLPSVAANPGLPMPDRRATHEVTVLSDMYPGEYEYAMVRNAIQRLTNREGRAIRLVGKHIAPRFDMASHPWQLYVVVG